MTVRTRRSTTDRRLERRSRRTRAPFTDAAAMWSDMAVDWAEAVDDLLDRVERDVLTPSAMSRRSDGRCTCGCEPCCCEPCTGTCDCGSASCHCRCCIGDADLIVNARVGERRVVPIRIENRRRRERDITVELSPFRSSAGRPVPIEGRLLGDTEFSLGPCEARSLILMIGAGASAEQAASIKEIREAGGGVEEMISGIKETLTTGKADVDDCVVGYADLRVDGCGHRPIRVAVPLSPLDCDVFDIACDCGCC